jgi:hypothetical protein
MIGRGFPTLASRWHEGARRVSAPWAAELEDEIHLGAPLGPAHGRLGTRLALPTRAAHLSHLHLPITTTQPLFPFLLPSPTPTPHLFLPPRVFVCATPAPATCLGATKKLILISVADRVQGLHAVHRAAASPRAAALAAGTTTVEATAARALQWAVLRAQGPTIRTALRAVVLPRIAAHRTQA